MNINLISNKNTNIRIDIYIFSILGCIIPFSLILGPALPDIILSLIAVYFIFTSFYYKLYDYYKNLVFKVFILFCFYGIVRSVSSEMPLASLANEGSVFYFRYIFFSLGIWYLSEVNPKFKYYLFFSTLLAISIVSIDSFIQYLTGENILGYKKFSELRLTGLFKNEPIVGRYISFLTIFSLGLFLVNFNLTSKKIIFISILSICSLIIVFLSGERSPFFNLFLFIMFFSILIFKSFKFWLISLIAIIFTLTLTVLISPPIKERMLDQSISQMSNSKLKFLPYSELHERHYISALKMFNENRLYGIGTNLFRSKCNEIKYLYKTESCSTHPHNYYIQILAELGIIGLLFIVAFYILNIKIFISEAIKTLTKKNDKSQKSIFLSVFALMYLVYYWPIIPHMSFYNNWNNVMVFLPLGFFMKFLYSNKIKY